MANLEDNVQRTPNYDDTPIIDSVLRLEGFGRIRDSPPRGPLTPAAGTDRVEGFDKDRTPFAVQPQVEPFKSDVSSKIDHGAKTDSPTAISEPPSTAPPPLWSSTI